MWRGFIILLPPFSRARHPKPKIDVDPLSFEVLLRLHGIRYDSQPDQALEIGLFGHEGDDMFKIGEGFPAALIFQSRHPAATVGYSVDAFAMRAGSDARQWNEIGLLAQLRLQAVDVQWNALVATAFVCAIFVVNGRGDVNNPQAIFGIAIRLQ